MKNDIKKNIEELFSKIEELEKQIRDNTKTNKAIKTSMWILTILGIIYLATLYYM